MDVRKLRKRGRRRKGWVGDGVGFFCWENYVYVCTCTCMHVCIRVCVGVCRDSMFVCCVLGEPVYIYTHVHAYIYVYFRKCRDSHVCILCFGRTICMHGSKPLQETKLQRFLSSKSVFLNSKFQIREFHAE